MRSPKRQSSSSAWYNYYAGYSEEFVSDTLDYLELEPNSTILDPWNGSGTTTAVAEMRGYNCIGYDLNPAMLVIAASRRIDASIKASTRSLAEEIILRSLDFPELGENDPLLKWTYPSSASKIRSFTRAIDVILIDRKVEDSGVNREEMPPLASFYYLALFRAFRCFLTPFTSSNPSWIKVPKESAARVRPSREKFEQAFMAEVVKLSAGLAEHRGERQGAVTLALSDSRRLPLENAIVDAVITSPPYCTRLDYVIATLPELAILGVPDDGAGPLRNSMLGTPTIVKTEDLEREFSAQSVNIFLNSVRRHKSKAARSYYLKTFVQYFAGLQQSLSELSRALKANGSLVAVVQDSYFKNLHIDVPAMFGEFLSADGVMLVDRVDYAVSSNMAGLNSKSKRYRSHSNATECALVFRKS